MTDFPKITVNHQEESERGIFTGFSAYGDFSIQLKHFSLFVEKIIFLLFG